MVNILLDIDASIKIYKKGEISIKRASELLDVDIYRMQEILRKHGVRANISYEKFVKGVERSKTV